MRGELLIGGEQILASGDARYIFVIPVERETTPASITVSAV